MQEVSTQNPICLCMIVRNESHIVTKTLNNICEHIPLAYFIICDTGSTDSTIELCSDYMMSKAIPGEVLEHEWVDFAYNRNKALEACRKWSLENGYNDAYAFIFDADDSIYGDFELPDSLTSSAYAFKLLSGSLTYVRPLLVRLEDDWKFVGVIHECLISPKGHDFVIVDGDYYVESGRQGARSQNPSKYADDARLLETTLKSLDRYDSMYARYAFYCAQSWEDANQVERAVPWYKQCALKLNNWTEERYVAAMRLGRILLGSGKTEEAIWFLTLAADYSPARLECVCVAADVFIKQHRYQAALNILLPLLNRGLKDREPNARFLFANAVDYSYGYLAKTALCAYYVKNDDTLHRVIPELLHRAVDDELHCETISRIILENAHYYVPSLSPQSLDELSEFLLYLKTILLKYASQHGVVAANKIRVTLDLSITRVLRDFIKHNSKQASVRLPSKSFGNNTCAPTVELSSEKPIVKPLVMFTITTCKRLDLFLATMESVLVCIEDLHLVTQWFLIDDGSSNSELEVMRSKYPFFTIIQVPDENRGHRGSMNLIHKLLMTNSAQYWVHLEDDWFFFKRDAYIQKAIDCLESAASKHQNVKQVLFNKGYGETIGDVICPIGTMFLPTGNDILLHVQNQSCPIQSSTYWPHYSFRPGVTDVRAIRSLGKFDAETTFFELAYAKNYVSHGYRTAYFNDICCLHSGKLSGFRGDTNMYNAYQLNKVKQFDDAETQKPTELTNSSYAKDVDKNELVNGDTDEVTYADMGDYMFIRGYDMIGNDIEQVPGSVSEMLGRAAADCECLAVNTLGYFKHALSKLVKIEYFKENDGIFVKKSCFDKLRLQGNG